jgi:glycine oxidase
MSAQCQRWQRDFDMKLNWLDRAGLHELEPELSPDICGAIFAPEEGAINGGRLTLALARAAANWKGQFLEGCLATGVRCSENRFVALQTHAGEIAANHLVIAAGAWSRTFCEELGLAIPIAPARGQMLAIRTIRRLLQHPAISSKGGISPKADGTVFVGATVELAGFDKRLRPADSAHLLEMAAIMLPELRQGHIDRSWAGLRPYCEDGLPVIGMLPNWGNIAVAAGHFQLGITGSAITGQVIKDLIVQGRSEQAIEPFSPARFVSKEQIC